MIFRAELKRNPLLGQEQSRCKLKSIGYIAYKELYHKYKLSFVIYRYL